MSPSRSSFPSPAARRAYLAWAWCMILWVLVPMPLLALPVDWAEICSCEACPFEGGPSCCCRQFPTIDNADGSPGKRLGLTLPTVTEANACSSAEATLTVTARLKIRPVAVTAQVAPDLRRTFGSRRQDILILRDRHFTVVTLPRPPPALEIV